MEIQVILARLLLDYHFEGPADMHWSEVKGVMKGFTVPAFPKEVRLVPRSS
jgi:hypothetical protein